MKILEKLKHNHDLLKDTNIEKKIETFKNKIIERFKDNRIFFIGNGGSAAQAQHFSTELIVRYKNLRKEAILVYLFVPIVY